MRRIQVQTHTLLRYGCNALCAKGKCAVKLDWRGKRASSWSRQGVRRIHAGADTPALRLCVAPKGSAQ